jgi:hypothetical protein
MSTLKQEKRDEMGTQEFAFPKQRKEPLNDAAHVRSAVARFNQVTGVTDHERDQAWQRIRHAAERFDVEISEASWHELPPRAEKGRKKASSKKASQSA